MTNSLTLLGALHVRPVEHTRIMHVPTRRGLHPSEANRYLRVGDLAWIEVIRGLANAEHNDWQLHPSFAVLESDRVDIGRRLPVPDPRLPVGTWKHREKPMPESATAATISHWVDPRAEGDELDATAAPDVIERLVASVPGLRLWLWRPEMSMFETAVRLRPLEDGEHRSPQSWRGHAGTDDHEEP